MLYKRYGEIRTTFPDQELINSLKSRLLQEEKREKGEGNFKSLWEIYYYLFYGLYSAAWKAINNLKEEDRWLIPADVYHGLEAVCT